MRRVFRSGPFSGLRGTKTAKAAFPQTEKIYYCGGMVLYGWVRQRSHFRSAPKKRIRSSLGRFQRSLSRFQKVYTHFRSAPFSFDLCVSNATTAPKPIESGPTETSFGAEAGRKPLWSHLPSSSPKKGGGTCHFQNAKIRRTRAPRNSAASSNANRATKMELITRKISIKNSQKDDAWKVVRRWGGSPTVRVHPSSDNAFNVDFLRLEVHFS